MTTKFELSGDIFLIYGNKCREGKIKSILIKETPDKAVSIIYTIIMEGTKTEASRS